MHMSEKSPLLRSDGSGQNSWWLVKRPYRKVPDLVTRAPNQIQLDGLFLARHIIPVSKRDSNTDRNIQLLCEICNRQKGQMI